MHRVGALYKNEMLKISKKVSVLVLILLMVVGIFGIGLIVKLSDTAVGSWYTDELTPTVQELLKQNQEEAAAIEQEIKTAPAGDKEYYLSDLQYRYEEICRYELMLKYDISLDAQPDYETFAGELLEKIVENVSQARICELRSLDTLSEEEKQAYEQYRTDAQTYERIFASKAYEDYVAILNREILEREGMAEEEKQIYIDANNLRLKASPEGKVSSQYLSDYTTLRMSLLYNSDITGNGGMLTPQRRTELENRLTVTEYRIQNQVEEETDETVAVVSAVTQMYSKVCIILLMIVLAGGAISSELSTGSIKSLIIAPVKRYKIFTAKLMSILTIGFGACLLAYLCCMLANGIFFGFGGQPYIYASGGHVYELNFYLYHLFYMLLDFVEVIVYASLALMLSTLTKNTAVSVGLSMAFLFVCNIANSYLSMVGYTKEWMKFLPFGNLSITEKVFSNGSLSEMMMGFSVQNGTTLAFSICYIAVVLLCMLYSALDSFNRRDIK